MKKALIFDLDNTIYPVKSISDRLFAPLIKLLSKHLTGKTLEVALEEITKRPFQKVADSLFFGDVLKESGTSLLRGAECDEEIIPYEDYKLTKGIHLDKFLVTTGFTNLQWSKVRQLGIEQDFKEIIIVDPDKSSLTKADAFLQIMAKYSYKTEEILVIGDDPESEIAAAKTLGIDTYLYDPKGIHPHGIATYQFNGFSALEDVLGRQF